MYKCNLGLLDMRSDTSLCSYSRSHSSNLHVMTNVIILRPATWMREEKMCDVNASSTVHAGRF